MTQMQKGILLVSQDAALCRALRAELEQPDGGLQIAAVGDLEPAQEFARRQGPAVILLDESVLGDEPNAGHGPSEQLEAATAALAGSAPVVVLGHADHQRELATLVAAGAADFVARTGEFLPVAVALLERRLRLGEREEAPPRGILELEDFGETLRHELNNPLTGILGNAELLLAEIRRRNDGCLPQAALQRLETITDLAVRMRETIRRLSNQRESWHDPVRWG